MDEKWGSVTAEIELNDELAAGLAGIEQFSHAIIIFLMHRYRFDPARDLIRRPQERADMPLLGAFAQRAKHRPNPIGITAVELIKVQANKVTVRGLDAIDGTPVLDIKPYVPAFDMRLDAVTPDWMEKLLERYF